MSGGDDHLEAWIDVLQTTNLTFAAILIGGMVMEFMMILPTVRKLSPDTGLGVLKLLSPIAWRYLPVCGTLASVSALTIVALRHDTSASTVLTAIGFAFAIAGVSSSAGFYLRADRGLREHTSAPADYVSRLEHLSRLHLVRLFCFGTAFVCWAVAAAIG